MGHLLCVYCTLQLLIQCLFVLFIGMTNALAFRPFHELTVYQRVWIVKSLCDHCVVCTAVLIMVSI